MKHVLCPKHFILKRQATLTQHKTEKKKKKEKKGQRRERDKINDQILIKS